MMEVLECTPESAVVWQKFLAESNNGTLFHDLDFLGYHAAGKFQTRHLMFYSEGRLVALLPAAATDGRILKSPYGASVGGPVLPPGQPALETAELVHRVKQYAVDSGLEGIEMRIAPPFYSCDSDDHLGFALLAGGFQLVRRHLCHVIPLPGDPERVLERCTRSKLRDIRIGLRRGLQPGEVSGSRLPDFYRVLSASRARLGAVPTHSQEQLADLFRRVPAALRLFLCEVDGQTAAGILVFVLNRRVAYTFYIDQDEAFKALRPTATLLMHVAQQMAREGFAYLDLGPTTFDDLSFNTGLATFKEEFGARGHCRDTWRWQV